MNSPISVLKKQALVAFKIYLFFNLSYRRRYQSGLQPAPEPKQEMLPSAKRKWQFPWHLRPIAHTQHTTDYDQRILSAHFALSISTPVFFFRFQDKTPASQLHSPVGTTIAFLHLFYIQCFLNVGLIETLFSFVLFVFYPSVTSTGWRYH